MQSRGRLSALTSAPSDTANRSGSHDLHRRLDMHRAMRWASITLLISVARLSAQQPAVGRLVADTVHAKSLEHNLYGDSPDRSMLVYLPPSYESSPNKRYPVIYLLHGFGGDERD